MRNSKNCPEFRHLFPCLFQVLYLQTLETQRFSVDGSRWGLFVVARQGWEKLSWILNLSYFQSSKGQLHDEIAPEPIDNQGQLL